MADNTILILAAKNPSALSQREPEYRRARNALLAEEIKLRHERVPALRRALPPGGKVPEDHAFEGHERHGPRTAVTNEGDASLRELDISETQIPAVRLPHSAQLSATTFRGLVPVMDRVIIPSGFIAEL